MYIIYTYVYINFTLSLSLPVQLIDDHLPDRMGSAGAVVGVSVALVRHLVVQRVRPDWGVACTDSWVRDTHQKYLSIFLSIFL